MAKDKRTPAPIFPIVVADAGPLIHLDEVNQIELLDDFPRILLTETVQREVEWHRPSLFQQTPKPDFEIVATFPPANPALASLTRTLSLDAGEQSALQILSKFPEALFLTDDTAARVAAKSLGYQVHGTLGILLRAVRRGQRTQQEIAEILASIPSRSSLHVQRNLLAEIIQQVWDYSAEK